MSDTTTTTLSAIEGAVPAPPPPPGGLAGTRVAAVAFLVLVTVPAIAYVAGVRPVVAENRVATPPPAPTDVLRLDADALGQLSDHLVDALPGRDAAVRADAWLDLEVFATSPTDEVVLGGDDWLYLRTTLTGPCRTDAAVEALGDELARAADVVARTGRRLHTLVAPDKATMYPDRLPTSPVASGCGQAFGDQVRRLLEPAPPPGYVPFWDDLETLRDGSGTPVYFAADTHWRTEASAVMVEAIVDAVDPTLFDTAFPRRRGEVSITGDLSLLLGLHRVETERPLVFERPGVTWELSRADDLPEVPADVAPIDVSVLRAAGGAVVPDRVTMLHDSFAYMTRPQLAPFFAELVMVRKHPPTVPWVSDVLRSSHQLVFEVVERDAWDRVVEDHLAAALAAALRADLPSRTQVLDGAGDGWSRLSLRAGDVLVLPGLAEAPATAPYLLEVRRAGEDGAGAELRSQATTIAGEELVFDTAGIATPEDLPVGAVEVRLRSPAGEVLAPTVAVVVTLR